MAVGDLERAFAEPAAADGIVLTENFTFPWLNELGHLYLLHVASQTEDERAVKRLKIVAKSMAAIFAQLRGKKEVLAYCRFNRFVAIDLVHEPTGTIVELDAVEHFTTLRQASLDLYPSGVPIGFDPGEYWELCAEHHAQADKVRHNLAAKHFGFGGIPRERVFYDALKDLAPPAMGHPATIRLPVPDGDGAAAYARSRDRILKLLGS